MQMLARADQIPALKAIWAAGFPGDSPEDIDGFFARQFRESECLVHLEDGTPVSMTFMLPAVLRGGGASYPVQYIYAASTLPAYRGRGIFGRLLRRAHAIAAQRGQYASFLRPGEVSLTAYYRRFGYRELFTVSRRACSLAALPTAPEPAGLRAADGAAYAPLRNRLLACCPAWIEWGGRFTRQAARDAAGRGGGFFAGPDSCALCERTEAGLLVQELLCPAAREAACLRELMRACGVTACTVLRPVRPGETGGTFGMWLPLRPEAETTGRPAYMGLTLE